MIKYLWLRNKLLRLLLLFGMLVGLLVTLSGISISYAHGHAGISVAVCDQAHLQSAITSATAKDTITFQCSGTITLTNTLAITKDLTLAAGSGQTVTLDGNNTIQVLLVGADVHLILNRVNIAHGKSASSDGGGLVNYGVVDLSHSILMNNFAIHGGAIWNADTGRVNVSNSTFMNNSATRGADIYNDGGMISVSNCTIRNKSGHGTDGDFYNDGGTVDSSNGGGMNSSSITHDDDADNSDDVQPTPKATRH
ncbi:hypothetical protein KDW_21670 [Dictyobacter vulcani]|uniref:Right handed beta helix domain-containing protein n=1 Tax=Dictyobacter vulcani TaxID=2607529 RepID=A0A5J4KJL7_9CHLR|nr:hypothetical protein [Dictyobacter vulcani]GER88005.1 hypothetical protein KDW_21670 [Dictyobacter vulcani]